MKLIQTLRSGAAFLALGCALLALPLAARAAAPETPLPEPAGEQLEQQNDSEWMRLNYSAIRMTVPSGASAVTEQLYVADSWYGGRVTWTSSDSRVASVDSNGLVTARRTGTATITARNSYGEYATCTVEVRRQGAAADHSALNRTSMTLTQTYQNPNPRQQLMLDTVSAPDCTIYHWYSSNDAVASVNNNGVVTAHSVGTAHITAYTTQGETLTCEVTVRSDVGAVTLNEDVLLLQGAGGQQKLTASVAVADPASVPVTWTSSDPDVAVVSADGMVTAVADGSARITATTPEGRSASCDVYVGQAAKDYDENATLMGVVVVGGMAVLFGVLVMAAVSAG